MWKVAKIVMMVFLGLALIQLVPYGRSHVNPPVKSEPAWSSPQIRALAQRACFDCHSNETVWPWYSEIAPMSWAMQSDVDDGRYTLNFSEWKALPPLKSGGSTLTAGQWLEMVIQAEEMPPAQYVLLHPGADLSSAERAQLAQGFLATFDAAQK